MSRIALVGLTLSLASFVALGWLLRHAWRSRTEAGGAPARRRPLGLRLLWSAVLLAGFALGLRGVTVAEETRSTGSAAAAEPGARPATISSVGLRLPFYARDVSWMRGFGGEALPGEERREALQVPWPFLLVVLLYWFFEMVGAPRRGERAEAVAPDPG